MNVFYPISIFRSILLNQDRHRCMLHYDTCVRELPCSLHIYNSTGNLTNHIKYSIPTLVNGVKKSYASTN
jgi:hypothetical protein